MDSSQYPKREYPYTVRTARSVMNDLVADIKARKGTPDLPTGIHSLDELIWGIHKREVQVIAARPSQGKTSLAIQIATHLAALKRNVLFISLEMTNDQVMERALCSHCGISGWDLRRGLLPTDFDEKVLEFKGVVENLDLFLVDNMGSTFEHVKSIFTSMDVSSQRPDVVLIDYINLVSPEGIDDDRQAIKKYIRALKEFAKFYRVAIVVVAQINREAAGMGGKAPQLHNLKETGALEEVSDTVCLLHWKRDTLDPQADGEYTVIVAKARHGPIGSVNIRFNAEHYRFEDVPVSVEQKLNGSEPASRAEPVPRAEPTSGIEASLPKESEIQFP